MGGLSFQRIITDGVANLFPTDKLISVASNEATEIYLPRISDLVSTLNRAVQGKFASYIISDLLGVAETHNITIYPADGDTIFGATSYTINVNNANLVIGIVGDNKWGIFSDLYNSNVTPFEGVLSIAYADLVNLVNSNSAKEGITYFITDKNIYYFMDSTNGGDPSAVLKFYGIKYDAISKFWNTKADFLVGDVVAYKGRVYTAIKDSLDIAPDTDPTYWEVVATSNTTYYELRYHSIKYDLKSDWIYERADSVGNVYTYTNQVDNLPTFGYGNILASEANFIWDYQDISGNIINNAYVSFDAGYVYGRKWYANNFGYASSYSGVYSNVSFFGNKVGNFCSISKSDILTSTNVRNNTFGDNFNGSINVGTNGVFQYNTFESRTDFSAIINGTFRKNFIGEGTKITDQLVNGIVFSNNTIKWDLDATGDEINLGLFTNVFSDIYIGNTLDYNARVSTFSMNANLDNASIFDGGTNTFTIFKALKYAGVINFLGGSPAYTIDLIIGEGYFERTFKALNPSLTVTVNLVTAAAIVDNQVLKGTINSGAASFDILKQVNGFGTPVASGYLKLDKFDNFWAVTGANAY